MEKICCGCHEHHQHLMQLLSLPLSWGQEKRKHWYFQQNIFTFTELWCVLAVVDRHRERKTKNLIPARLGIYSIFVFGFHQICEQFAYNALRTKVNGQMDTLFQSLSSIPGIKVWRVKRIMKFHQDGLDCTIRSLIVAISTDTYFCLFCPLLTLFACPAVRRNVAFLSRWSRS